MTRSLDLPDEEAPFPPGDDTLKAYRVGVEIRFDLERAEVETTSWTLKDFRIVGRDMFVLLDRLPAEIATWFHDRYGVEVVVIPVYSTITPRQRRVEDGYVVLRVTTLLAEARTLGARAP
jgi:hypothetical protein